MKKHLIVIGITLMLLAVGFSGCVEQSNEKPDGSDVLTKTYDTVDDMYNAIYKESLSFRETVTNIRNSLKTKSDIINYTDTQFEIHKVELNNHDLSTFDRFGEYQKARNHIIGGLESIINKDYKNARSNFDSTNYDVWYISQYTGYSVKHDFGFEELIDLLSEM